jgi:L-threonylcarbamoyladenylate synthase
VQHIFAAKGRPAGDPLIVHIHDIDQLAQIALEIPALAVALAAHFWPGALTLILRKQAIVPDAVTAGQPGVAIRMPDHPIAQALLRAAGVPIAAPSANRFSRPSPTTAAHVLHDLDGRVDLILDGGNTRIGVESTILDLTTAIPTVLRPGGIALETLQAVIPTVAFRPRHILEDEVAPAPGTLLKHYSPDARVLVYVGNPAQAIQRIRTEAEKQHQSGQHVGILTLDQDAANYEGSGAQIALMGATLEQMAANLFGALRDLDAAGVSMILVHAPQQIGMGLAVYDRLLRAAEGQIIEVEGGSDA